MFSQKNDQRAEVQVVSTLSRSKSRFDTDYTINADVAINVQSTFEAGSDSLPELPRMGMRLRLPGEFNRMKWYGRGPHENYQDRNTSAFIGLYESTVADQFVPYMTPQENGNKTGVRWATLTNDKKMGLKVMDAEKPLSITAHHFQQEDLQRALDYYYQVPQRNMVELHIDLKQCGVGGDNSWGNKPLNKYRLLDNSYRYNFTLVPVAGE